MKKKALVHSVLLPLSAVTLLWACSDATDGSPDGAVNASAGASAGTGVSASGASTTGTGGGAGATTGVSGSAGAGVSGSAGADLAGAGGSSAGATNVAGSSAGGGGSGGVAGAGGSAAIAGSGGAGGGSAGSSGSASGGSGGGMSTNGCPVKLEGWATVNANSVNGTTGGGTVAATTVTTFAELKAAAADSKPRVIIVKGTIKTTDGGGSAMPITSNKTIYGADKNATIYGGVVMSNVSNIILRNLNIHGTWPNSGPDDTVASHGSHHIWYDHLNIWDSTDGSLDITNASNYQTVSWSKFWYTSKDHPHRLASLNGSGGGDHPEDSRNNKVTYHHNWWSTNVNERMPRVMYGKGHSYNNYFNSPGNLYCIGVGSFGSVLIENNYFKDVNGPHEFMYLWHMYIAASGNVYDNTTGAKDTGMGGTRDTNDPALNAGVEDAAPFTPPYQYSLDKAADIPALVQKCAGPQ